MTNEHNEYFEEKNEYLLKLMKMIEKRHNIKTEFNKPVMVDGKEQIANIHLTGLFASGVIVSTRAVELWIMQNNQCSEYMKNKRLFVQACLFRHFGGDWGILSVEDELQNEYAVNPERGDYEDRIMSVYKYPRYKDWDADYTDFDGDLTIWIITEWDRSVTTVLFPSDY